MPTSSRRPHMPGYGIIPAEGGSGLLPWSWAEKRLTASHEYWLATVWPDGRPHVMPIWGVWFDAAFWFCCSVAARKARNLAANPACVVTTDDALNPVVIDGTADLVRDEAVLAGFIATLNAKYSTSYGADFFDPALNSSLRVRPRWAFGLLHDDFTGSPTRWDFSA